MIDEYQIVEAKAMGADVILLIAACLSPSRSAAAGTRWQRILDWKCCWKFMTKKNWIIFAMNVIWWA